LLRKLPFASLPRPTHLRTPRHFIALPPNLSLGNGDLNHTFSAVSVSTICVTHGDLKKLRLHSGLSSARVVSTTLVYYFPFLIRSFTETSFTSLSTFLAKMPFSFPAVVNVLFCTIVLFTASPVPCALTPYAPVPATCPSTPLGRAANEISSESSYINQRSIKTSTALAAFLKSRSITFFLSQLPVVALTTIGG
jgi:hypothetical protein